jgi:3-deoxy-D-arabino-heptulosonate 7-phosphate (DAHP) synthase
MVGNRKSLILHRASLPLKKYIEHTTYSTNKYTDSGNFFLLAGPCAIEGEEMAMQNMLKN